MTNKADKNDPAEVLHEIHEVTAKAPRDPKSFAGRNKPSKSKSQNSARVSGSKKTRKGVKDDLASDPDRMQRDRNRFRDEMVVDAPASGSREDQE